MNPRRVLAVLFSLALAGASTASAQIAAELTGRVLDPAGAAVRNAHVELTNQDTGVSLSTVTTSSGDYVFINLAPGSYRINVTATGFSTLDRRGITVTTGQTTTADLTMTIGSAQQTVTVTEAAPLLQAATSNIQTNISAHLVVAMPLNTRNFVQLATLAPGVELPPGTLLPRINGGRPRTNEYLFDGISALQPEPGQVAFFPLLDDIQEFTIEADNVPAEFGRFNGGVVNVATRAGSDQLHGSVAEYLRNEDLNARNYFSTTGRKPDYRRNLYAAAIGGPIVRNRLFFFGDFQGVRQLIGVTRISTIPTMNERKGIFTGVSSIFNPATTTTVNNKFVRQEFPSDVINTPFDPAAVALLAHFPIPTNLTAAANNYTRTANDADHQAQFDARVDGAFRSSDRAFGRYTYYNEVEQPVTPLPDGSGLISGTVLGTGGVAGLSNVLGQQAVFNETHTFSAHLLNDFRLGYTRRSNNIVGTVLGNTASASLGIPGIPTNAAFNNALPLFTFTGFQQLGPSASTFSNYQTAVWQAVDTLTFTRGRHTFKAGADLRWYQLNAVAPPNPTGSFAFTTTGTDQQGVTNSGNAIASFLLGQVDTFSIDLQESQDASARSHRRIFRAGRHQAHRQAHRQHRRALYPSLPFCRKEQPGRGLQPRDPAARLPRRQWQPTQRARAPPRQCRAAHRPCLSAHAQNRRPRRLRHRLLRSVRNHHALHHSAVPVHPERPAKNSRQHQCCLRAVVRAFRRAHSLHPECRSRPERLHRQPHRGFRLLAAMESRRPARDHPQSLHRFRLRRLAHCPCRHSRFQPQPADRGPARPGLVASDNGHQSLLWSAPHFEFHRRKNRKPGAAPQALSALPQHRHLPQQQRQHQLQRGRSQSRAALRSRLGPALFLHPLAPHRRCLLRLFNHRALLAQFQQPHRGRHLPPLA